MTKNMSGVDRAIRLLVAATIAGLYFTGRIGGTVALILGLVAGVFFLTSLLGWCPTYLPFGLSTRKSRNA